MSPSIIQFVTSLLTPLVVAVVTAVLTVQLSFRRFQSERWWDRKADAYSRIIEALHHLVAHASMTWAEWVENATYSDEYKKKVLASQEKAFIDLEMVTGVGAYVISDEAAKVLAQLASRPKHENPWDDLDANQSDYAQALAKIRELAKKDLKVR
jgi:hypothetical protein